MESASRIVEWAYRVRETGDSDKGLVEGTVRDLEGRIVSRGSTMAVYKSRDSLLVYPH